MTDIKSMTLTELKELMTELGKSLSGQNRFTAGFMSIWQLPGKK